MCKIDLKNVLQNCLLEFKSRTLDRVLMFLLFLMNC